MRSRALIVAALAAVTAFPATACARTGHRRAQTAQIRHSSDPLIPVTVRNQPLTLVAAGLHTPTAFAFGDGQVFESDYGSSTGAARGGGVYLLAHGRARRLPGSPAHVFGVTWHHGWLYMSTSTQLLRWGDYNGSLRFGTHQVLFTAPPTFLGFNGVGFGADGRLYAGTATSFYDHDPISFPYAREVLTFSPTGGRPHVFATGIRQPFQMAFAPGSSAPYVSDLGQDSGVANPPDMVLRAHDGDNFGFPQCNWTAPAACQGYARPLFFLAPHYSPMGLGVIGSRLYVAEYGTGTVISVNLAGRARRDEVRDFNASVVGLGTHGGYVYAGQINGRIWRWRPGS